MQKHARSKCVFTPFALKLLNFSDFWRKAKFIFYILSAK